MENFLVPTDFSVNSQNAYEYAKALSDQVNGKLKVVHFCHPNSDAVYGASVPMMEELFAIRTKQLDAFIESPKSDDIRVAVEEEMIEREVIVGFAGDGLIQESKKAEIDLILMGTRSKSDFLDRAFGSVSSTVSQNAHCPVWLVPPHASFKGIKNILYASDYSSADENMIQTITSLATFFDADVHLVHVNENKKKGDVELEELILEKLFNKKNDTATTLKINTIQGHRVWEGLYEYAENHAVDLVVMVTQHRNFWEKIRHKSQTREMVLNAKLPMLVLHLDD